MFLFLSQSIGSSWLAWKFRTRMQRKAVDEGENVQHWERRLGQWGSSALLTMIAASAALRRNLDDWMLRTEMEHPSTLESSEIVRKKWEGEIKAQVSLFTFDSEAVSLLRELPPANEEPSHAKHFRLKWKIECLTLIRMSGVDNCYYKKWWQSSFFFACLIHTAQALLWRDSRDHPSASHYLNQNSFHGCFKTTWNMILKPPLM